MEIDLIQVPYDSGRRNERMGRGPFYFVENGTADRIRKLGIGVNEVVIEPEDKFTREIWTGFELMRKVAGQVKINE